MKAALELRIWQAATVQDGCRDKESTIDHKKDSSYAQKNIGTVLFSNGGNCNG